MQEEYPTNLWGVQAGRATSSGEIISSFVSGALRVFLPFCKLYHCVGKYEIMSGPFIYLVYCLPVLYLLVNPPEITVNPENVSVHLILEERENVCACACMS